MRRTGWCLTTKLPLKSRTGQIIGLAGLSRDLSTATSVKEDYGHIAAVVSYIRNHFHEPLKVRQLAAQAELSEYQFEQRIRRIFHITPGQLIQKVRMDAAVHQLGTTDQSIAQVALDCGYADQSSFTRQFKQTVGLTPAEYRRATQLATGGQTGETEP